MTFREAFTQMQRAVHATSRKNGFEVGIPDGDVPIHKLAAIALIHSELGEATEAIRLPGPDQHLPDVPAEAVEMADVVIRAMLYCERFGFDLADAIERKHAYNQTRPYKHGKVL